MRERVVIQQSAPRVVIDKWTTEYVQQEDWGTFGAFLEARRPNWDSRYSLEEKEARDRRNFGTCVGCNRVFRDSDLIHFAQSVKKNNKMLGNRFTCTPCARRFEEFTNRRDGDGQL